MPAFRCSTQLGGVRRFGRDVLETAVRWTGQLLRRLYGDRAQGLSILDVGCGNGTMLVGLAAQGFSNLAGQDYSANAVELARQVLQHHNMTHIPLRVSSCKEKRACMDVSAKAEYWRSCTANVQWSKNDGHNDVL